MARTIARRRFPPLAEDRAYYVLPPGNYGGLPTSENSLDQLALYDALTPLRGNVTGSAVIDEGSIVDLDPVAAGADTASIDNGDSPFFPAAGPPPQRLASNFLIMNSAASVTNNTQAVMGPQLGYFYPEIVMQIHLSGPGIEAQGAAVPGLAMYMLIGRTENYAWSLTTATHDLRDPFAEVLCNPDGSEPSRESLHYEFHGECIPFEIFNAGTLGGDPVIYPVSVHGPMIGTATSNGQPIALSSQRSTFGRDGLNLAGLKAMTEGDASTPEKFWEDVRSPVWPVVSEVLRGGEAPSPLAAEVVDLLDAWVADDAPRLDADDDGFFDEAGPTIMDALFGPLATEVMRPVFGDYTAALNEIRDLGGDHDRNSGSVRSPPGASFVDKDLRTLLGQEVRGKFNLSYCGNGSLEDCRDSLWRVVDEVAQELAAERGDDPSTWLREGWRVGFEPGLIPETIRATNRPTFQQVLEFVPSGNDGQ